MKVTITKSITLDIRPEDLAKLHRMGVLARFIGSWFNYAPLTLVIHHDEADTKP